MQLLQYRLLSLSRRLFSPAVVDVQPRHWRALATRIGGPELWNRMQSLVESAPGMFDHIELPRGFPEVVISKISQGVRGQSRKFFAALSLQGKGG